MSMDYYFYLKSTDGISSQGFEAYCASIGYTVRLHPDTNLLTDEGFVPACLTDDRFAMDGNDRFLSGVDWFIAPYRSEPEEEKPSGLWGLFRRKNKVESPLQKRIRNSTVEMCAACHFIDAFELLIAQLLGAYLIKTCGAVMHDPQSGKYFDDETYVKEIIDGLVKAMLASKEEGTLRVHPFERWES